MLLLPTGLWTKSQSVARGRARHSVRAAAGASERQPATGFGRAHHLQRPCGRKHWGEWTSPLAEMSENPRPFPAPRRRSDAQDDPRNLCQGRSNSDKLKQAHFFPSRHFPPLDAARELTPGRFLLLLEERRVLNDAGIGCVELAMKLISGWVFQLSPSSVFPMPVSASQGSG